MCGICGALQEQPAGGATSRSLLEQAVSRMNAALLHRGPDDGGTWLDTAGRLALGNRRLAIIDLSPAGHQPMADAGGEVVVTYNGEIYNFQELRAELAAAGYPFRGRSDTEVILALYLREGRAMVRRLRGMFALALWDGRTQRLILARDRLGIKPLYYTRQHGRWIFASEIRALRASGLVPGRLNHAALAAYLRLGSVPGPMTILSDVEELPPASMLVVDGERAAIERYWEIPAPQRDGGDPVAAARGLRDRLRDSVARHLISDVPLGVFLSGGIDSGAIVAMMREAGHSEIRTFSITFPEAEYDEGADASRVAARYGTRHTAWQVRGEDVAADLDRVIAAMDQPTVDGLNTYFVSRATRASGTIVALSGLGGDELFCGYPSFRLAPRLLAWQRAVSRAGPLRPVLSAALAVAPSQRSAKLRESLAGAPDIRSAYLAVRGLLSRGEAASLLAPGPLREAVRELDAAAALGALAPDLPGDPVSDIGVLELRGYMHNQLLRDTDVMSMAHSLEVRVPFLDHVLVEFASSLPLHLRANGRPPKWLLLQALGDSLPPQATGPKRGFTFPLGVWMQGALRPRVEDALRHGGGVFSTGAIEGLRSAVQSGRAHWSRLWAVVVLTMWLRAAGIGAVER